MVSSPKPFAHWKYSLLGSLVTLLDLSLGTTVAVAQVTADQTLPAGENTRVNPTNGVYEITGGAIRGNHLFHSFESFSLSTGQEAFFNHANNIDTILGRVTGGSRSDIDGIIGTTASSTADIFFINPQGIVFGPNAALNIGGSFIASTAERIIFADDAEFSASEPQSAILTVSQPLGLVLGDSSGSIVNESFADEGKGLGILPGETIVLVGNGIDSPGGRLTAPSGRIELASIAPGNSVNLISRSSADGSSLMLSYGRAENQNFRDIQLSSNALLDVSDYSGDNPSGSIQLRGRQISLAERSKIQSINYGISEGGEIYVTASERLILSDGSIIGTTVEPIIGTTVMSNGNGGNLMIDVSGGTVELHGGSRLLAQSEMGSAGAAGDLTLNAANLRLQDFSEISTSTFSREDGGDLTIDVSGGTVELLGTSRLRAQSEIDATGVAGDLTLNATTLRVRDGSVISTSALGDGSAGRLLINTPNGSTEIVGLSPDGIEPSFLSSTTEGKQPAGELQINTRTLLVQDGGLIQSGTFSSGSGGRILINATESVTVIGQSGDIASEISSASSRRSEGRNAGAVEILTSRLVVRDGATIFTSTRGSGQGGDLTVRSDEVILAGQSGLFARTGGSGDSGRLTLTADTLVIQDGARITVSTDEDAPVANLGTVRDANITARTITLDNGQITAESLSGDGGILNITVQDFILMRNNSLISTTAGTAEAGGDGGDIFITMPDGFIVARPNENSDIIANAFEGDGGNINITAQGIFNLVERPANPETNDIDASSEFGESGTITINNLNPDPTQGLIELPAETISPTQIAQRCLADSAGRNAFVATGQGGVTPTPAEVIQNETVSLIDLGNDITTLHVGQQNTTVPVSYPSADPIVEAQSWYRNKDGEVVFVAPIADPQNLNNVLQAATGC